MSEQQTAKQELGERIGKLADTCDNLSAALDMPLPFHIHKQALKESLESMRNDLRAVSVEMTGDNPWTR